MRKAMDYNALPERYGLPVQRWDVYDAADHIADIPWLIAAGKLDEAAKVAQEWQHKLFRAAEIKGPVGPYPEYRQLYSYSWICADCRDYNCAEDRICVFCGNPQPHVTGITALY